MLAAGTLGRRAESRVAPVALAVDAHADRLLDAQHVALGGVPLARLDLQAVAGAQLLRTLLVHLRPGDLGRARILSLLRLPRSRGGRGRRLTFFVSSAGQRRLGFALVETLIYLNVAAPAAGTIGSPPPGLLRREGSLLLNAVLTL